MKHQTASGTEHLYVIQKSCKRHLWKGREKEHFFKTTMLALFRFFKLFKPLSKDKKNTFKLI